MTTNHSPPGYDGVRGEKGTSGVNGLIGRPGSVGEPGAGGINGEVRRVLFKNTNGSLLLQNCLALVIGFRLKRFLTHSFSQPGLDGVIGRDGRKGTGGFDGRPGMPGRVGMKGNAGIPGKCLAKLFALLPNFSPLLCS